MNALSSPAIPLLHPDTGAPRTRAFVAHEAPTKRNEAHAASVAFASVRCDDANAVCRRGRDTVSAPARQRPPTCYYALKPADDDAVQGKGGHYKGRDLRGTRGYERLVDTLTNRLKAGRNGNPLTKDAAQAAVDDMDIKRGTTLLAPCHEGHTRADRFVHSNRNPAGVANRAPGMNAGVRQRRDAEPAPEIKSCPTPSGWKRFLHLAAPILGAFADYTSGATATPRAIHPDYAAANRAGPCRDTDN